MDEKLPPFPAGPESGPAGNGSPQRAKRRPLLQTTPDQWGEDADSRLLSCGVLLLVVFLAFVGFGLWAALQ